MSRILSWTWRLEAPSELTCSFYCTLFLNFEYFILKICFVFYLLKELWLYWQQHWHGYRESHSYRKDCKTQITQIRRPKEWEINIKSSLTMTVLELHQGWPCLCGLSQLTNPKASPAPERCPALLPLHWNREPLSWAQALCLPIHWWFKQTFDFSVPSLPVTIHSS